MTHVSKAMCAMLALPLFLAAPGLGSLCRHCPRWLRLRSGDESELLAGQGRQRELHHDERPRCAAAGATRIAVRVL